MQDPCKKVLSTLALAVICCFISVIDAFAQKQDTILVNTAYKSYFSNKLHEPILVTYKLFHGGGECNRSKFRFKNDAKIKAAKQSDYAKSGYDEGHCANAEDFAYDCTLDELTFRFYNCVPQTPNLNRGLYKKWETTIRKESQSDSLLIICGNIFGKETIGKGKIAVPKYCFKVIQSLSSKSIIHVLWFTNTDSAIYKNMTLAHLEDTIGYKLPLKK